MTKLNNEFKLCYVEEPWAYFTTQELEDQWGDDWNDCPYEHNAGTPYRYHEVDRENGKEPWEISCVAYSGDFETPCYAHAISPFSVEDINSGAIAWLRGTDEYHKPLCIGAGVSLEEFVDLIQAGGGKVYTELQDG